jgi:hypothetical protein
MRCGPETGGGDSGVSALTSEPLSVGGRSCTRRWVHWCGDQKVSVGAARTAYAGPSLPRALS